MFLLACIACRKVTVILILCSICTLHKLGFATKRGTIPPVNIVNNEEGKVWVFSMIFTGAGWISFIAFGNHILLKYTTYSISNRLWMSAWICWKFSVEKKKGKKGKKEKKRKVKDLIYVRKWEIPVSHLLIQGSLCTFSQSMQPQRAHQGQRPHCHLWGELA